MKKPIKSYTESVEHKGEKLEVTINVFKEPVIKTPEKTFYTQIAITKDGKMWGTAFYESPVADTDFEAEMQNTIKNLDHFKAHYEPNQEHYSQN